MNAGDQVDQRGLARAVRADQADDLALSTEKLTPSTAFRPPNRRDTLSSSSSAVMVSEALWRGRQLARAQRRQAARQEQDQHHDDDAERRRVDGRGNCATPAPRSEQE